MTDDFTIKRAINRQLDKIHTQPYNKLTAQMEMIKIYDKVGKELSIEPSVIKRVARQLKEDLEIKLDVLNQ